MYKYKGKRGEVWINERKDFIDSLSPGSNKKIRGVCPECREEREMEFNDINKYGHTFHQGCIRLFNNRERMIGKRFGRLVIIGFNTVFVGDNKRETLFICKCDCGETTTSNGSKLKNGQKRSCGCLQKEKSGERAKKRTGPLNHFFGKKGEKSPTYKRELTEEQRQTNARQRVSIEGVEWRKKVYERDRYTCQCCNKRGGELEAHHMDSFSDFPEKRFDVGNGLTLCKTCHRKLHRLLRAARKTCTRKECESVLKKMKEDSKQ